MFRLSILTYYGEPTLPELLNGKVIQTLMDVSVCASSSAQKHALSVLRNMSFQAFYRSAVLSTGCVPHMVRFLTSSSGAAEDEFNVRTAVISLMALASNNQRIKCEVRSLADNWFQRNIPPASEIDADPQTTAHLFQRLRRLIDE